MSAHLPWYDSEQRILICKFMDEFDTENYAVLEGQLPMIVREVDHRVDVILYCL